MIFSNFQVWSVNNLYVEATSRRWFLFGNLVEIHQQEGTRLWTRRPRSCWERFYFTQSIGSEGQTLFWGVSGQRESCKRAPKIPTEDGSFADKKGLLSCHPDCETWRGPKFVKFAATFRACSLGNSQSRPPSRNPSRTAISRTIRPTNLEQRNFEHWNLARPSNFQLGQMQDNSTRTRFTLLFWRWQGYLGARQRPFGQFYPR